MVEQPAVNRRVAGSSPAFGANLTLDNQGVTEVGEVHYTETTQVSDKNEHKVKFPLHVRHRKQVVTIYAPTDSFESYRAVWNASGKRLQKAFKKYGAAKDWADKIVRELADGSPASALSPRDASDALVARQALDAHFQATGRKVTLLDAVKSFAAADKTLDGKLLGEALATYMATSASIKRTKLADAVEAFLAAREPLTRSKPGERPQLSPKYEYNVAIALREFATTFPGTDACDLNKDLVTAYMGSLDDFAPKTRNHRRVTLKMFLGWCVRQDYLPVSHKIDQADAMAPERANQAEVEFYTADEFRALLSGADADLLPMLTIGGLAGLRTAEMFRLDWSDVWRVAGHIEVTAQKAKTRQRRLVEICPSLASWLNSYREKKTGPVWPMHENAFHIQFPALCKQVGMRRKTNGLRHSFCTFHFALHSNENLTSSQAGNSPSMIHAAYKGLATRTEGERWFNVAPAKDGNVVSMAAVAQ